MLLNCDLFSALFMISARRLLSSGVYAAAIACLDTAADPPNSNNATKTGTRLRFVFLTSKPSWLATRVWLIAGESVLAVGGMRSQRSRMGKMPQVIHRMQSEAK